MTGVFDKSSQESPFGEVHHIGLAVRDIVEAVRYYVDAMGLKAISEVVEDPIQRVRVAFLAGSRDGSPGLSRPCLELVEPMGADSPVNRTIDKGVCGYHACYEVDGMQDAIDRLVGQRALLVSAPKPAKAFGGRRISWLFLPTRHLVELLEAGE